MNAQPSEGGAPCYVSVDRRGRFALVATYVGGNVALLPLAKDGRLEPAAAVVQHEGKGPNAERQEGPSHLANVCKLAVHRHQSVVRRDDRHPLPLLLLRRERGENRRAGPAARTCD